MVIKMKIIREEKKENESELIGWISGGITSAVACWLMRDKIDRLVNIDTFSEHPDNKRFIDDLSKKFGKPIEVISVADYQGRYQNCRSHFDILELSRSIKFPGGAACTNELKRKVRERYCKQHNISSFIWGFDVRERERVVRMKASVGQHHFPLFDAGMTKQQCANFVQNELGIRVPEMYRLGFPNANCIGCVKGGAGYWNLIRVHFPEIFKRMALLEREIGHSCLRKDGKCLFLDELDPKVGRNKPIFIEDCGSTGEICEIQRSIQDSIFPKDFF